MKLGALEYPDDIDRRNPVTTLWCSAFRKGSRCANGFKTHGIACAPATIKQADRFVPPCCQDNG